MRYETARELVEAALEVAKRMKPLLNEEDHHAKLARLQREYDVHYQNTFIPDRKSKGGFRVSAAAGKAMDAHARVLSSHLKKMKSLGLNTNKNEWGIG